MFVRRKRRFKDGKEHRYWSVVENVRVSGGRVVQRQVLYLGEINDSQRAAWCRSIEVLEGASRSRQVALFPEDREAPELECEVVQVRLAELTLHDPRQWGAYWLALTLWDRLALDRFWGPRLPASRQGTRWLDLLKVQVCYRLIDPGSDWRLHRHWYEHSALRDLLGCDRVIASNTLYRCLDKLAVHKHDFFSFLRARWTTMFNARFDILLYDLTSTYFESASRHCCRESTAAGAPQAGCSRWRCAWFAPARRRLKRSSRRIIGPSTRASWRIKAAASPRASTGSTERRSSASRSTPRPGPKMWRGECVRASSTSRPSSGAT